MNTPQQKTDTGWINAAAAWLMGGVVEHLSRFSGERYPGLMADRIAVRVHRPLVSKRRNGGLRRPSRHR